jgi:DMSO reductase iron-sulfur subunit
MTQLGFTFDLDKCVGCQACQIACSIENDLGYDFSWRAINTYNPEQVDALPHYHLSLACNHCREAICLYQCPAKAISKNPDNGIVIIDENKCIGCKFCSWVCPYDAPNYNSLLGVMTKCTLCSHRIEEKLEPACVSICPTDALNISSNVKYEHPVKIAGFPESEIKPCIQIEPFKPDQQFPEQYTLPYSKDVVKQYSKNKPKPKSKITISGDWTLAVFTLLISILGGLLSTSIFSDKIVNPISFGLIGLVGMVLSTLHLGKKFHAYRAILNWKTSWLSREVLFFSLFMFFSLFFLLIPDKIFLGYIALSFGLFTAISADNVYSVIAKTNKRFFHSAQVWITLTFFIFLFNQFLTGVVVLAVIKILLYIQNKFIIKTNSFLTFLRVAFFVIGFWSLFNGYIELSFVFLILSELIDRIEFYISLEIITPQNHLLKQFSKDIYQI